MSILDEIETSMNKKFTLVGKTFKYSRFKVFEWLITHYDADKDKYFVFADNITPVSGTISGSVLRRLYLTDEIRIIQK